MLLIGFRTNETETGLMWSALKSCQLTSSRKFSGQHLTQYLFLYHGPTQHTTDKAETSISTSLQ